MERKWRHRITVHTSDDILGITLKPVEQAPPMIFCDDEGACYFDSGPNPLTQAIEQLLNQIGEEGWELVQIVFRPDQIISFWKQEVTA